MSQIARRMIGESVEGENAAAAKDTPLPVIQDTRPQTFLRCPHCKEEIYEKHSYVDENGVDHHRGCGGAFKYPPPSQAEVDYFKKHWGMDLSKE